MKDLGATLPRQRDRFESIQDTRHIALTAQDSALEYFLDDVNAGFVHVLRYAICIDHDALSYRQEGLMFGLSNRDTPPCDSDWNGETADFQILSEIDLGTREVVKCPESGDTLSTEGEINVDPIIFVNFEAASSQFREIR